MKERIILAPGIHGTELIRNLALQGVPSFNVKVCGAAELARMALLRSGIPVQGKFINNREETAYVAKAIKGETYFGRPTYQDIRSLTDAIRRMRSLVTVPEEEPEITRIMSQGIFTEKNQAILSVYRKYLQYTGEDHAADRISLIRQAIAQAERMDTEFIVLEEYPLNPLEQALLDHLSGGLATFTDMISLFGKEKKPVKLSLIRNCYGASNEVEMILTDIYGNKQLDQCTVAVADNTTYGQLFFDYALLYDLPVTIGCGIPIINSNPAKLVVLYYQWMTQGFFSAASVEEMLDSPVFDQEKLYALFPDVQYFSQRVFRNILGSIRFTDDRETNEKRLNDYIRALAEEEEIAEQTDLKDAADLKKKKRCIPALRVMAEELALPPEEFVMKYARIRKDTGTNAGRLLMTMDTAAVKAIYEELKVIRNSGVEQDKEDILRDVLKLSVSAAQSEEGKIFVTGINGAPACMRRNLYIAGLSASKYPGSPKEDYLLLDEDLKLFGEKALEMTSEGRIARKKERLYSLVRLASSLETNVYLSYSGLNVSELKKDNPSSLIFELFREEHGVNTTAKELEEQIKKVDYFEPSISVTRNIGKAYNQGKIIMPKPSLPAPETETGWNLDKAYSPTALGTFFDCPRRFMLRYILGIPEPDDDKPFEVISAAASGTLAHTLMENLGSTWMSPEEFRELSAEYFDRYIAENPPLIKDSVPAVREEFLEMMRTAYEMDPHRIIVLDEEDIHCTHESGVKIHGYPDRVEKLEDDSVLIVDFKTGRQVVHVQDDISTCLQIVIYAYLMEKKGFNVSGGEFRYIRNGETVSCKYDTEMKGQLLGMLQVFRDHMIAGDFPVAQPKEDNDPCKYCKYAKVCGKETEGVMNDE